MEKVVGATDIVRNFSEILNSVKYKRERYTILRGGKAIACISPVKGYYKEKTLKDLKELLKMLPRLDDEVERFEKNIRENKKHQPSVPKEYRWV